MGATGSAIVNFGLAPGANVASIAVTGQTGIVSKSLVEAFMMADTTVTTLSTQYRGVNIFSGSLNYQQLPAVNGTNYLFPDSADITYLKSIGCNFIRLCYSWEAVQPTLGGSISNSYTTSLQAAVTLITNAGMYCMLEPYQTNSSYAVGAYYNGTALGTSPVTYAQYANLMTRMATLFTSPLIIWGLMDEPANLTTAQWWGSGAAAQSAITAIRGVSLTQMIFVPGLGYTAASTWTNGAAGYGTANSVSYLALLSNLAAASVSTSNLVVQLHSYFDTDQGGTTPVITSPTIGVDNLSAAVTWAQTNGVLIHLSEFGADVNWTGYSAPQMLSGMYAYMLANASTIIGGAWYVYTPVGFNPNFIGTTSGYTAAPFIIFLDLQPASAYSFNTSTGNFTYIPPTYTTNAPDYVLVQSFLDFNNASAYGHNAEEHKLVPIKLTCGSIVVGTGFTIWAETEWRLTSTFQVRWVWV